MITCKICGESKELTEYYKGRRICKRCVIDRVRLLQELDEKRNPGRRRQITNDWVNSNREKVRAYNREWMRNKREAGK